jgi:hypothetical protein
MHALIQAPAFLVDSIDTELNIDVLLFNALDINDPWRISSFTYIAPPFIYKAVLSSDQKHLRLHMSQVFLVCTLVPQTVLRLTFAFLYLHRTPFG